uniref:Myb/SANT-like domain-containing protein n=1 Tax=Arundo donax TaxID=35708 RepID=A0A0A9GCT8_ARUDO
MDPAHSKAWTSTPRRQSSAMATPTLSCFDLGRSLAAGIEEPAHNRMSSMRGARSGHGGSRGACMVAPPPPAGAAELLPPAGAAARPPGGTGKRPYRAPRSAAAGTTSAGASLGGQALGAGRGSVCRGTPENSAEDETQHQQEDEMDPLFNKADWTNYNNNAAFCELCVEEIKAGNRNNGFMTSRAYKNIGEKFFEITGLCHSRLQFKNRWEALKWMSSFWLWLNKQTGLGRANGTVVASEDFWMKHTKGHAEWRKLKFGPPSV